MRVLQDGRISTCVSRVRGKPKVSLGSPETVGNQSRLLHISSSTGQPNVFLTRSPTTGKCSGVVGELAATGAHVEAWMSVPPNQFDDPQYWRRLAEQSWSIAEEMSEFSSKDTIHRIARDYERKARDAEERLEQKGETEPKPSESAAGAVPRPLEDATAPLDREATLKKLEEIDRHIALGKEHIARQREIIDDLDREGRDIARAKELLENLL